MIENFEIMGLWWLPEDDNKKVPGVLKFIADKEIKLELMGSFHESIKQIVESKQIQYFEIILGVSKGVNYTLFRSWEMNTSFGSANSIYMVSSFHCKYIFKGIHFLSSNDVKFAQMSIGFTYLEDWVFPNPFKREGMDGIKYINPPKHDIKIEKINSIISIVSGVSGSVSSKTVSMSANSSFVIKPIDELKGLEWYEDVIDSLENFLTLVIGRPIYPITKTAYLSNSDKFQIYYALKNISFNGDLHFSQMMLPYNDLSSYLDEFLNNWFNYSDMLEPINELFFGTYYAHLYVHFYFLSLIQAIEAFHRRIYGDKGKYLSNSDYEPIRSILTTSIPTNFSDGREYPIGFRDSLKNRIRFGNEYSLRTRLKQLSNVWDSLDPLLYENKDEFNNYIVCTRNYLTHYEKKSRLSSLWRRRFRSY